MTPPSSLGWRRTKTMSSTAMATIWERLGQWGTPEVRWSGSGGGGGGRRGVVSGKFEEEDHVGDSGTGA